MRTIRSFLLFSVFFGIVSPADTAYTVGMYLENPAAQTKLMRSLSDAGMRAKALSPADMENEAVIAGGIDCIVFLNAFPEGKKAKDVFIRYLKAGGDIVIAGNAASLCNSDETALPMFEPNGYSLYSLEGTVRISPVSPEGAVFSMKGVLRGTSAVGFTFPAASEYLPLLAALDRHGRTNGYAAGTLVHYAGPYSNGQWLLYGINEPSFYDDQFASLTSRVLTQFRSGTLLEQSRERSSQKRSVAARTAPKPSRFVKIHNGQFIAPSGKRLFLTGANMAGAIDVPFIFGSVEKGTFDAALLGSVFSRARDAGINCFRVWSAPSSGPIADALRHYARKYQIYLYLCIPTIGRYRTEDEIAAWFTAYAKAYADEPMVLGYDLENEPLLQMVAPTEYGGKPIALIRGMYEKYKDDLPAASIDFIMKNGNNGFHSKTKWLSAEDKRDIAAAWVCWLKKIASNVSAGGYSTFPGFTGKFDYDAKYQDAFDAVNGTFALYIATAKKAIREADADHFITIGYNTELALLPANDELDFTSAHVYQLPTAYEEHMKNMTVMDKLKMRFPAQPITLGEFGYSAGYLIKTDGVEKPITVANQTTGEMMFYLYAFAKGYSGAAVWMLDEIPASIARFNMSWVGKWGIKQQRHGIYYYNGDPSTGYAGEKPLAKALRFFRKYADSHDSAGASMEITPADTQISSAYTFTGEKAFYVGALRHTSDRLRFTSDVPVNVLMDWNDGALSVLATSDIAVSIDVSAFVPGLTSAANVSGTHAGKSDDGKFIRLELLRGETVRFAR